LPAAALAKLVGPQTACRIVLTLVVFGLPAACWLLLRAFDRDTRLSVFAPAAFHTVPLYMGFFNFVASVPVAIAAVALVERELRAPSRGRAVLLAAAAAALFWLHPSAVADRASFEQVLRAAEPGRRLVSLMFQQRSRWFQFDPYMQFGMCYEVERGGRARYNFAEVPWTPIRFRSDAPPVPSRRTGSSARSASTAGAMRRTPTTS